MWEGIECGAGPRGLCPVVALRADPGCPFVNSLGLGTSEAHTGVRVPCPGHSASRGSASHHSHWKQGCSVHLGDKINGVTSRWRASPLHGETRGSMATGTNYHPQDGCARAGHGPKIHRILHQPPVLYPSDRNLIQAGS